MRQLTLLTTCGGLLHDIGKMAYRSGGAAGTHSRRGYEFLRDVWRGAGRPDETQRAILDCVLYHHEDALQSAGLPPDSPAWIVSLADNISAAADRRKEEESDGGQFDRYLPLKPVFSKLNGRHDGWTLPPDTDEGLFPLPEGSRPLQKEDYQTLLVKTRKALTGLVPTDLQVNPLLSALETLTDRIPSSTYTGEAADISLYDHLKTTAALAACIGEYAAAEGISDYERAFFREKKKFYAAPAFLLYSADVSGIQKFIYTITTKNALRSLRSRSFFLELMMEHYIDELLSGCGLSRANLLYSGGGHCYLLLPNTAAVRDTLEKWNRTFNRWLMGAFGTRLYLADGCTACSAAELSGRGALTPDGRSPYQAVFRRVSRAIAQRKFRRYTAEELIQLNAGETEPEGRECRICGRPDQLVRDRDGESVCVWCGRFENAARDVRSMAACVASRGDSAGWTADSAAFPLPALDGGTITLTLTDEAGARERMQRPEAVRLYVREAPSLLGFCTARLDTGVYSAENAKTLDDLADRSQGIRRLAVCRMDVDNLGQAFVAGFEQPDGPPETRYRYETLSRKAAFSRQMSLFFKRHINGILDGTALTGSDGKAAEPLHVSIVYSGGDDVFLLGAWNDTLRAADRIQAALDRYSCGALTISAGIGLYTPHYPIRMAAEQTAELEDASKELDGKNAVTLFETGGAYTYHWREYREQVMGEKRAALEAFFSRSDNERGNSFLYRILELLRESEAYTGDGGAGKGIALARFAYLLARMEPGGKNRQSPEYLAYREFSDKMYSWALNPKDRRELLTAIMVYVYENRTGTGENYGV